MITACVGPLGSGKTYYAVNYLMKYIKYDKIYDDYHIHKPDVLIISNIEGLRCNHWHLNDKLSGLYDGLLCEASVLEKALVEFFSIKNFENIMKKTGKQHIILLIDEVHYLFPSGYYNKSVYEFFAYCRHIGLDVIMLTQGMQSMTKMFNPLFETIHNAVPRSKQLLKNMSYTVTDFNGKYMYGSAIRIKQVVFGLYKSFRVDEKNKPKNAIHHWLVIIAVFFVLAILLFKGALAGVAEKGLAKPAVAAAKTTRAIPYGDTPIPAPLPPPVAAAVPAPPVLVPAAPISTLPVVAINPQDMPRVIGLVDAGKDTRYLLSSGQIVSCKRQLNIGDIYIK